MDRRPATGPKASSAPDSLGSQPNAGRPAATGTPRDASAARGGAPRRSLLLEPVRLVGLLDLLLLIDLPLAALFDERVQLVLVGAELVQILVLRAEDVRHFRG